MQLTFLGTSAGTPTLTRNVSSLALRLPERADVWLFDCGEATQHQLLRTDLSLSRIRRIFITHLHGDHLFGLPGLLASAGLAGDPERIDVYGPPGLSEFLAACFPHFRVGPASFPVDIHVVEPGLVLDDGRFAVRALPLRHRVPTFGYRVDEHPRPGSLDAAGAAALGVPAGPLLGRLKRGERLTLPDGREIDGQDLLGPPEPGRSLAYCTDTTHSSNSVELARQTDLLVHEATFAATDADLAAASWHSTAIDAARVAAEAGVAQLVLTHLSARYALDAAIGPEALLAEARTLFPATILATDFLRLELPRHRSA